MANAVYGLVLAGGESRRMGRDKALLNRGGQTQLAYIGQLVGDAVDRVFVSTRATQKDDIERGKFEQIVDRYDNLGPIAGILSALEVHPDVDWLIVACDLPNIDASTIEHLLTHREPEYPFSAFISSYDGLPEPLCAVYHSGCHEIVQQFVVDGVYCPRKIMIRSDTQLLEQPDSKSLDNINTPDDLEQSVLQASE